MKEIYRLILTLVFVSTLSTLQAQLCPSQCAYMASESAKPIQYPISKVYDPAVNVVSIKHLTVPKGQAWVQKIDENCLSADPEDCYLWCSVLREEESDTLEVLLGYRALDSTQYEMKTVYHPAITNTYVSTCQVYCPEQVTETLVSDVSKLLASQGYDIDPAHYRYDNDFFYALEQYQIRHSLPIGQLNIATLVHLGVPWSKE